MLCTSLITLYSMCAYVLCCPKMPVTANLFCLKLFRPTRTLFHNYKHHHHQWQLMVNGAIPSTYMSHIQQGSYIRHPLWQMCWMVKSHQLVFIRDQKSTTPSGKSVELWSHQLIVKRDEKNPPPPLTNMLNLIIAPTYLHKGSEIPTPLVANMLNLKITSTYLHKEWWQWCWWWWRWWWWRCCWWWWWSWVTLPNTSTYWKSTNMAFQKYATLPQFRRGARSHRKCLKGRRWQSVGIGVTLFLVGAFNPPERYLS